MMKTLVIGYGNMLRCDDGAGPQAADRIAAMYPHIDCLSLTELTPELAETVSHYDRVLFVDASVGIPHLRWQKLRMRVEQSPSQSHALMPDTLIELSIHLFDHCPQLVELVEIPAYDFDYAEELSPLTEVMVEKFVALFGETIVWMNALELESWTNSESWPGHCVEPIHQSPLTDSSH